MTPARPEVGPVRPWSFPEPERATLPGGLEVLGHDLPGQHVLSLRLAVPLPLSAEPRGLEGVGTLMARTLDEGAGGFSAEEMAELLERRGIAIGAGVGELGLVVQLDVPSRRLTEALELLRLAIGEPAFAEPEVRRHVRTRLAEIDQAQAQPAARAALEFAGVYYPAQDRFSRPTGGDSDTVASITPQALRTHHRLLGPAGASLVVAGDLAGIDTVGRVEEALGSWRPATGEAVAARPTTSESAQRRAADAARIVLVDRPGSVQSELYLGCPGPDRTVASGWAPYPVLSFVVGGAPQARLDAVLREEKGYTYGMRSSFRPRGGGAGLFLTSGSVRAETTVEALGIALDLLDDGRNGFTEAETRAGVDFLSKTAPGRYATADAVADEAAARALDGLGTAHTSRTLEQMRELGADDLTAAYRRYVDGEWTVVVVGDAATASPERLERLGRGPVTVLEAESLEASLDA